MSRQKPSPRLRIFYGLLLFGALLLLPLEFPSSHLALQGLNFGVTSAGCPGPPECVRMEVPGATITALELGTTNLNSNNSTCSRDCNCSNLRYEGYCDCPRQEGDPSKCVGCSAGRCDAKYTCKVVKREACDTPGAKRPCFLPAVSAVFGSCKMGIQICQPSVKGFDIFKGSVTFDKFWGNCYLPYKVTKREDVGTGCYDGKDNNCNGLTDSDDPDCANACAIGSERSCYTGNLNPQGGENKGDLSVNAGACRPGIVKCQAVTIEICEDDSEPCTKKKKVKVGKWPDYKKDPKLCVGQVVPQKESCNKKDDDCDGNVDEDLPDCDPVRCKPGAQKACYNHLSGCSFLPGGYVCHALSGCRFELPKYSCKGACKVGTRTCSKDGTWGSCEGQVFPRSESCEGAGVDEDCDGSVDENCECTQPGATRSCYGAAQGLVGKGICRGGTQTCKGGVWSPCAGQTLPRSELCNGLDDDCDGKIDNVAGGCKADACCMLGGIPRYVTQLYCLQQGGTPTDISQCSLRCCLGPDKAITAAREDVPLRCTAPSPAFSCKANTEVCCLFHGATPMSFGQCLHFGGRAFRRDDSRCSDPSTGCKDGETRSCQHPCGLQGSETCRQQRWGSCVVTTQAKEICDNGKDDDCDGQSDEGCPNTSCTEGSTRACTVPGQTGSCAAGTQACKGGTWGACKQGISVEVCDGKDNDCDGTIDETYAEKGQPCKDATKRGDCQRGIVTGCIQGTPTCTSQVQPSQEFCDGRDNDCNGKIDDNCLRCVHGSLQSCFVPGAKGLCESGSQDCNNGVWGKCTSKNTPATEVCNGIDDDCDGLVDEQFPKQGQPCTDPSKQGECQQGSYTQCANGQAQCTSQVKPAQEVCDGKDNDCDGDIDELAACACTNGATQPCDTGLTGDCKQGTQSCVNQTWGPCKAVRVGPEICNGKDDDCDGAVDVGCKPCNHGATQACQLPGRLGVCAAGTQSCQNGVWAACSGGVAPSSQELCNGKDDDCDGLIDEIQDLKTPPTPCKDAQGKAPVGVCQGATLRCRGAAGWPRACSATDYAARSADYQATETACDGLDNDCDGKTDENCPWIRTFDKGNSVGYELAEDARGNLYVTGRLTATGNTPEIKIGAHSFRPRIAPGGGPDDIFVASWDAKGALRWIVSAGGGGDDRGLGIALNSDQSAVYVTGYLTMITRPGFEPTFGNITLRPTDVSGTNGAGSAKRDAFVARYDAKTGALLWVANLGGLHDDYGVGVASVKVNKVDRLYLLMSYNDSFSLTPTHKHIVVAPAKQVSLLAPRYISYYYPNVAVVCLEDIKQPSGTQKPRLLWVSQVKSAGTITPGKIAVHAGAANGPDAYILGTYAKTNPSLPERPEFLPSKPALQLTPPSGNSSSQFLFVARLDHTGTFAWATQVASSKNSSGHDLRVGGSGHVHIVGSFGGQVKLGNATLTSANSSRDVLVARLDAQGTFLWANRAGSDYDDRGYGIEIDAKGNTYITGSMGLVPYSLSHRRVSFGPAATSITSNLVGESDIFAAKLNPQGQFAWAVLTGGSRTDDGLDILRSQVGPHHLYVTGSYATAFRFGHVDVTPKGSGLSWFYLWQVAPCTPSTTNPFCYPAP